MKRNLGMTAALVAVFAFALQATALPDIPIAPGGFYDGTSVARVDTNATTSITTYTPRKVGDVLLGKVASTNCMWVARGLTTNNWSIGITAGGPFTSADIVDNAIVDADINSTAAINATKIGAGGVSSTEFGYLDGVTSAIQTQINTKQATLTAGSVAQANIATNNVGAKAIVFTSTLCTNVLVFNAQGILLSCTNSP